MKVCAWVDGKAVLIEDERSGVERRGKKDRRQAIYPTRVKRRVGDRLLWNSTTSSNSRKPAWYDCERRSGQRREKKK